MSLGVVGRWVKHRRVSRAFQNAFRWRGSPHLFQPFNHTEPDRYPWLFRFARETIADGADHRILSFGCSIGDEAFALRRYFEMAQIKAVDISSQNIAECRRRAVEAGVSGIDFVVADTVDDEKDASFDAIFCLAVLCNGILTVSGAERSDPVLFFDRFEHTVAGFARCLKPGGLLCLVTTNFRFCDTSVAAQFDVVLRVEPERLAPDVLFDRGNRLMKGERYTEVAFRKR